MFFLPHRDTRPMTFTRAALWAENVHRRRAPMPGIAARVKTVPAGRTRLAEPSIDERKRLQVPKARCWQHLRPVKGRPT